MASRNKKREKRRNRTQKRLNSQAEKLAQASEVPNQRPNTKFIYDGPRLRDYNLTEKILDQATLPKPNSQTFYAAVGGIIGLAIGSVAPNFFTTNTPTDQIEGIFTFFTLLCVAMGTLLGFICGTLDFPNPQMANVQKYQSDLETYKSQLRRKSLKGKVDYDYTRCSPVRLTASKKHEEIEKSPQFNRLNGNELIRKIDWQEAEHLIAVIFRSKGWNATTTGNGTDSGVDVLGSKNDQVLRCQVKNWKRNKVGRPTVQQLVGQAYADSATLAVVVALGSGFTDEALDFTLQHKDMALELWGNRDVASLIDEMSPEKYEKLLRQVRPDLLVAA